MDKWLFEYVDTFDENFPTHMMMGKSEEEIIDIIKQCIKDGKPYEVKEDDNIY